MARFAYAVNMLPVRMIDMPSPGLGDGQCRGRRLSAVLVW